MKGHTFVKKQKHYFGFTIIEVSLYLAITAMLFVGIAMTTQARIENQRYNEAVNDYVEFLRNVYSEVENTQNVNYGSFNPTYRKGCTVDSVQNLLTITPTGQSNCAFYGKVVIFEEENNLNKITVADLIGETVEHGDSLQNKFNNLSPTIKALGGNSANTPFGSLLAVRAGFRANLCQDSSGSNCPENYAAGHYEYTLPYDYRIETSVDSAETTSSDLYKNKTLVIARAPSDSQIHTFWLPGVKNKFTEYDNSGPTLDAYDFCIDQSDVQSVNSINRRNIRILPELAGTHPDDDGNIISGENTGTGVSSPSSVILIAQDSNRNSTSENNGYYGNRCKW